MIKLSSTSIEINYNYNLKLNITRFDSDDGRKDNLNHFCRLLNELFLFRS